jgi:PAS domain S-box-containing protein
MPRKSKPKKRVGQISCNEKLISIQRDLVIALSAAQDLRTGMRLSVEAAIRVSGLDCGGIYLFDNQTGSLDLAYHQGFGASFIKQASHYSADSENVRLIKRGKSIYINYQDLLKQIHNPKAKEQLLATAIIPIKYNHQLIGCLNVASHSIKSIPVRVRKVLETIAVLIGGALARLKAESALSASEELTRSVFLLSPDSITLISLDGILLDCNPAALKLFGFHDGTDLKGISIFDYVSAAEHNKAVENIKLTIEKGTLNNIEFNLLKKDGSMFPAELSSSVVYNADKEPSAIIVICKDISERRLNEVNLRHSENRFRTIFEKSADSIFLADASGKFLEINDLACKELGYSKTELLRMKVQDIIDPADIELQPLRLANLNEGMTLFSKRRLICKDGSIIQAEITVRKLPDNTIIGIGRNVTRQRQYEQKIAMQARMLDAVQQSVVALDVEGKIIYWNEYSEKLLGYTKDEALNMSADFCLSIRNKDEIYRNKSDRLKRGQSWSGELTLRTKQGGLIPVLMTCSPIFDNGKLIGSIDVAFDISENKKGEEKLRQSEERYRTTFENTGTATVIIDENTIISMANTEFEKLTGYPKHEIEGKMTWTNFVVPDDLNRMLEQHRLRRIDRNSALLQYEFRLVTKSGTIRDILLKVDTIPGSKNSIASLIDITNRKQAEQALRLSEEKFAKAFKDNPAALAITRLRDGQVIDCNNTIKAILGYSIEEVLGRTTSELDIWVNQNDRDRMVKALHSGEGVHNWEVKFKAKNGSIKITQYSAEILELNNEQYILAAFIDLTEMKNAENELIKAKLRYQELFESLMEGVALLDAEGKIVFCNPAFLNIHEASSMDQIKGKNIRDILVEPDSEIDRSIYKSWSQGANSQVEIEILTAKGNKKTILAYGTPRLDTENILTGVIVAIIDITESKRLREFASYAQRLEAAGKIAGQVAHDFNNLLAPMVAYPELIKAAIPDDGFVLGMVNDIETAAKAMADINQQLLTLSRRGHYNLEIINLNDIINLAINQTGHLLEEIKVITELEPNLMNIKGGGAQILRIISNLIINAVDAMHERGLLTIKTENYYLDQRAGITGIIPRGEYCKVSISDTGCGIPEDVVPKIFDAFFTTKVADKKRGSGLGLSVVHAVMEDHHGFIDLESKVGKGSTFYLYFPITRDVTEIPVVDQLVGGSETILIIDDDGLQRNVNANLLNRLGYKIDTADSGESALALMNNKSYDILIIDMIMPGGIDGTETYRKSLEINSKQKALIISGFAETDRVKEAMRLGAGAFLRKPLSMKTLATAIRQELDKHANKPIPLPCPVGTAH